MTVEISEASPVEQIRLELGGLERHVAQAWLLARETAGSSAITARDLLAAAMALAPDSAPEEEIKDIPAFSAWATLLGVRALAPGVSDEPFLKFIEIYMNERMPVSAKSELKRGHMEEMGMMPGPMDSHKLVTGSQRRQDHA